MLVISPLTFHWYVANEALEIASNDVDKLLYSNVELLGITSSVIHCSIGVIVTFESVHPLTSNSSQIPFRSESFIQFPKQS